MANAVYEVGTATEVRAFHVMPDMEGPEGELHAHDYRLEVVVGRDQLDPRGMVCDLDVLEAAVRAAADRVRDADLEVIRPEHAEAVTVEIFAHWAHDELARAVRDAGGEFLTVRIWESPVAYGGYQRSLI
jgi:6-pyruvoyltetrahydropterin/6-carboxytetrahydropterin synthase